MTLTPKFPARLSGSCGAGQGGATLPEFALIAIVAILIIGVLIDSAVLFFRWSILTDSTARITHLISIANARTSQTGDNCRKLLCNVSKLAMENACEFVRERSVLFDSTTNLEMTARPGPLAAGWDSPPEILIEATRESNCIFCQIFQMTELVNRSLLTLETYRSDCRASISAQPAHVSIRCTGSPATDTIFGCD